MSSFEEMLDESHCCLFSSFGYKYNMAAANRQGIMENSNEANIIVDRSKVNIADKVLDDHKCNHVHDTLMYDVFTVRLVASSG